MWLQNGWHSHVAKLPVNQREENSNVISSDCNSDDACDDAINCLLIQKKDRLKK